jgi:hypothetical protein
MNMDTLDLIKGNLVIGFRRMHNSAVLELNIFGFTEYRNQMSGRFQFQRTENF